MLERCEVCRSSDKSPCFPIAGTSTASALDDTSRVDLLFLDDAVALPAPGVRPKFYFLIPVRAKHRQEICDVFRGWWIANFGRPKCP